MRDQADIDEARKLGHKREYEDACRVAGLTDALKWEDLSEEQRKTIREENWRYAREMSELGGLSGRGSMPGSQEPRSLRRAAIAPARRCVTSSATVSAY